MNHGFESAIKTNKTGPQTVYVYALNLNGTPGNNVLLGTKTVIINPRTANHVVPTPKTQNVTSAKAQAVIDAAKARLGSTDYYWLCQAFIWRRYTCAGIDVSRETARDAYNSWCISSDKNPPNGSCVYFDAGIAEGHVGIFFDGKVIHATSTVKIEDFETLCQRYGYLGWGWNGGVALN